jgi:hypothetical protein
MITKGQLKLVLKIKERERSRDRDDDNTVQDEQKHIKSEVIWNNVNFHNDKKKDKFLKLLGAKKPGVVVDNSKLDGERLENNFKKIQSDLTKQFNTSYNK